MFSQINHDLWDLLIRFSICNEYNDIGFISFQKIYFKFQNCSNLNALGGKFDLDIK